MLTIVWELRYRTEMYSQGKNKIFIYFVIFLFCYALKALCFTSLSLTDVMSVFLLSTDTHISCVLGNYLIELKFSH